MNSGVGRRLLQESSRPTVRLWTAVAAAVVEVADDSEAATGTSKTSAVRSPAAADADADADVGVRDVVDRTACGRRRGTTVATAAPACRSDRLGLCVVYDDVDDDVEMTSTTGAQRGRLTSSVHQLMSAVHDRLTVSNWRVGQARYQQQAVCP